mmetsp:Transcript_22016/g.54863  ORF Transcript_22016/g.54863 Transcript_22016/m.54863 type:complete len:211 (+) Transcript_22016:345-977(+)
MGVLSRTFRWRRSSSLRDFRNWRSGEVPPVRRTCSGPKAYASLHALSSVSLSWLPQGEHELLMKALGRKSAARTVGSRRSTPSCINASATSSVQKKAEWSSFSTLESAPGADDVGQHSWCRYAATGAQSLPAVSSRREMFSSRNWYSFAASSAGGREPLRRRRRRTDSPCVTFTVRASRASKGKRATPRRGTASSTWRSSHSGELGASFA